MSHWSEIRRLAADRRREVIGAGPADAPVGALISAALKHAGLTLIEVAPEDPLLAGASGVLRPDYGCVVLSRDLSPDLRGLYTAHELAHHWLHEGRAEDDPGAVAEDAFTDPLPFGQDYVAGYSPAQRRETEANVFAAEFLAPTELVRTRFLAGETAAQLAAALGVPAGTVAGQLIALLGGHGPTAAAAAPDSRKGAAEPDLTLDPSQQRAAAIEHGPVLVTAGPGTGKTRTLVGRALHLLRSGVEPEAILALTFSNRAANEMRDRLAVYAPDAARRMWVGTFHAFGLEVLRRWGVEIGLPPAPTVLDAADCAPLLERNLHRLALSEYAMLSNPVRALDLLLDGISRAKDDLLSPEDLVDAANRLADEAWDDTEDIEVARLREVASVYAEWQRLLAQMGALDFGDLIYRTVGLLRDRPDVLSEVRRGCSHILVDEYQDVNRASAEMLKLLADDGRGLWVVGDVRQAIYRFRGASPANVTEFERDFPGGVRVALTVNYRSGPAIVRLLERAAVSLAPSGTDPAPRWEATRPGNDGPVVCARAADEEAQADGIAAVVRRLQAAGVAQRDQAVLCRTHAQAGRLSTRLEQRGVPVLYIGDLFRRPEVCDLLSLLSLVAGEGRGSGLLRVAAFSGVEVTADDVRAIWSRARDHGVGLPSAIDGSGIPALAAAAETLERLADSPDAYSALARFLTGPHPYLRALLADPSVAAARKRLAIHQLLSLARTHAAHAASAGASPSEAIGAFLEYVRRLVATGSDTRARVPAGDPGVEGVSILTVHAAKGLEFPAVIVPNLTADQFPPRPAHRDAQLPACLRTPSDDQHTEDARLLFVAISRAQDYLVLCRPEHTARAAKPSPLLLALQPDLAAEGVQEETWCSSAAPVEAEEATTRARRGDANPAGAANLSARDLEDYMGCPRRFHYRKALAGGDEERSAYGLFQHCVWNTLAWLRSEGAAGAADTESAAARLREVWQSEGPVGHAHEPLLLAAAEAMVREAAGRAGGGGRVIPANLVVTLEGRQVQVRADHAEMAPDGTVVVERYLTGRPGKDDHNAVRLALLRQAAQEAHPDAPVAVRLRYLGANVEREVPPSPRYEPARTAKYRDALIGIEAGDFAPSPGQQCAWCPFQFVCPA